MVVNERRRRRGRGGRTGGGGGRRECLGGEEGGRSCTGVGKKEEKREAEVSLLAERQMSFKMLLSVPGFVLNSAVIVQCFPP